MKDMDKPQMISLAGYQEYPPAEMSRRSAAFRSEISHRRTVRHFSGRPVNRRIIEDCIASAGSAPSGANMQPWHFVVVCDSGLKREIRKAAEAEEREFYEHRAPKEWLDALAPLGTDHNKPFLETAPYLICIFMQVYGYLPDRRKVKHYYGSESVGIATGILITALHHAGLATLTHTPSPMRFLNRLCRRPENERPYLILVVGHPQEGAMVPDISRKPLGDICTFL
jgi:nitroreductase